DAELKWFLENAQPATEFFSWGQHMSWDVFNDRFNVIPSGQATSREFFRPWMLWDRCFDLAPEPTKSIALRLLAAHVPNRKPPISQATERIDFARQAGFEIRAGAVAYARTKDEEFLKRIEALLAR